MAERLPISVLVVGDRIGALLEKAEALFVDGVKVSFIARHPGFPDRDFVMGTDTLTELLALLQRRIEEDKTHG